MEFTKVILDHPGYYWYRNGESPWEIRWEPVQGYYSPPKLEKWIQVQELEVPSEFLDGMGNIIGKSGVHFKWITQKSKTKYIFFRTDTGKIEIWGTNYSSVRFAIDMLKRHFDHIRLKSANV